MSMLDYRKAPKGDGAEEAQILRSIARLQAHSHERAGVTIRTVEPPDAGNLASTDATVFVVEYVDTSVVKRGLFGDTARGDRLVDVLSTLVRDAEIRAQTEGRGA
jgi:hypothetical protein